MLKNKVALITGASRGIGAATAVLFGQNGCSVGVNYHSSPDAAESVVKKIVAAGSKAIAAKANVTSAEDAKRMVEEFTKTLGPIDILVLNAGMPVPVKPFTDLTYQELTTKTTGELDGFIHTLQAVVPEMVKRHAGVIIGVSSTLSRRPGPGFSSHSTAKSGIDGLMKSLALELGPHGIRVNTIAPGLTRTDATSFIPEVQVQAVARMTPLQRVGEPEDVAGAVLCMASEHMRFVTGAYIPVSGGGFMP